MKPRIKNVEKMSKKGDKWLKMSLKKIVEKVTERKKVKKVVENSRWSDRKNE